MYTKAQMTDSAIIIIMHSTSQLVLTSELAIHHSNTVTVYTTITIYLIQSSLYFQSSHIQ